MSISTRIATVMKTRATICSSPLCGGFLGPPGLCGTAQETESHIVQGRVENLLCCCCPKAVKMGCGERGKETDKLI